MREKDGSTPLVPETADRGEEAEEIAGGKAVEGTRHEEKSPKEILSRMLGELWTPLTVISGMLELLGSAGLAQSQRHYVEAIRSSCSSLTEQLNGLVDSMESDRKAAVPETAVGAEVPAMSFPGGAPLETAARGIAAAKPPDLLLDPAIFSPRWWQDSPSLPLPEPTVSQEEGTEEQRLLNRLSQAVADHDPVIVEKWIGEVKAIFEPTDFYEDILMVARLLKDFEYERALVIVQSIAERLKEMSRA